MPGGVILTRTLVLEPIEITDRGSACARKRAAYLVLISGIGADDVAAVEVVAGRVDHGDIVGNTGIVEVFCRKNSPVAPPGVVAAEKSGDGSIHQAVLLKLFQLFIVGRRRNTVLFPCLGRPFDGKWEGERLDPVGARARRSIRLARLFSAFCANDPVYPLFSAKWK